jgi:hypothetical protein
MSDILTKMIAIAEQKKLPNVRLPGVFMTDDGEPKEFSGPAVRNDTTQGFIDDRLRNANNYVEYAPRRFKSNMDGTGKNVHEDYPQSTAKIGWPDVLESTTPRQARGQKADTLTEAHDQRTTFDVSVSTFAQSGYSKNSSGEYKADTWAGARNPTTTQPSNPFNANYPYNHVRLTESGHLFEADDTPGAERIKEAHRTGTYYEVGPDGSRVTKIVRDDFTVIVGDERVNIQGAAIVTVEGDCNLYTRGNFTHQVDGDYNLLVKGKKTERVADDVVNDYHADHTLLVGISIDPLRVGVGKGNEGGSYKVQVEEDHIFTTRGNVSQIYGVGATPIKATRTVVGTSMDLIDGLRYEQTRGEHVDAVGGKRSVYTGGTSFVTVEGLATETYNGALTTNVTGVYNMTATSYNIAGGAVSMTGGNLLLTAGGMVVSPGGSIIVQNGNITSSLGDVIAGTSPVAISLASHEHNDPVSGQTGPPLP